MVDNKKNSSSRLWPITIKTEKVRGKRLREGEKVNESRGEGARKQMKGAFVGAAGGARLHATARSVFSVG